jgi:hypothetical protein
MHWGSMRPFFGSSPAPLIVFDCFSIASNEGCPPEQRWASASNRQAANFPELLTLEPARL